MKTGRASGGGNKGSEQSRARTCVECKAQDTAVGLKEEEERTQEQELAPELAPRPVLGVDAHHHGVC
eukprot:1319739-Rhodomonas_salina.1